MNAGDLRDRVTIQQKSTTADGQGGRAVTWATLATVSATVKPVQMSERLQAAAIGSSLTYTVTIRYRPDVTPAMRLTWTPYRSSTTKTLEIHGVQPQNRDGLVLECSEVI